jgi:cysteine desulfurase
MSLIYLDYQATTPVAPEVAAAMRPWLEDRFANPHSPNSAGRHAAAAVDVARDEVLVALHRFSPPAQPAAGRGSLSSSGRPASSGALAGQLYFTSGATEAANWALKGAAWNLPSNRRRIVTLATEHACVLDTIDWLSRQGFEAEVVPVGKDGLVDLDLLSSRITDGTGLVAAMLVNNEIGVIQPVAEIGAMARARGALFFCDAVQGFGRVRLPIDACDMVAISAHKVHGPKGIGALWVRDGIALEPLLHGGGQEGGIRSGTLSPALCVGFGVAARLLADRDEADHEHVDQLWTAAMAQLGDSWILNGSEECRYRGNLNIRRDGVDSARLISELREIAFSSGSACASGSGRQSHVLAALGLDARQARSSLRLGFGRYTREEELLSALRMIKLAADRQLSFAA